MLSFLYGKRAHPIRSATAGLREKDRAAGEVCSQSPWTYDGPLRKSSPAAISSAASLPPPVAGPLLSAAVAFYSVREASTTSDLWRADIDATLFDINYLQPFGFRYIESRNVKTT